MSTRRRNRALSSGALALALMLAGCGGSGSLPPATSTAPPAPTVASLLADGAAAVLAAGRAADSAETAVENVTDYSEKITTLSVNGDSGDALMNAQAVLDAMDAVDRAVTAANTALKAVQDAKDLAEDLPETTEGRAALLDTLQGNIDAAMEAVERAMEQWAEDSTLATALAAVAGNGQTPLTPADRARVVAEDIRDAFAPDLNEADGRRRGGRHDDFLPQASVTNEIEDDDHLGMTWTEIVGAVNIVDKRIAEGTTGNTKAVKANSVAGMTLVSTQAVEAVANGTQASTVYMGIPGTVFCEGDDCAVEDAVEAVERTLAGNWFFTPDDPEELWVALADGSGYEAETLYAMFGYWLADGNNRIEVFTYAATETSLPNGNWTTVNPAQDELADTSATYSGTALGLSFREDDGTLRSGEFTADVTLTASFGPASMLGGTVDNFQGNAVDPAWSVELVEAATSTGTVTSGVAVASGRNGLWTADSYAADNVTRAEGIFGGFNAHFTGGHAAGAFATRKD